jgi:hypothetical protein
MERDDFEDSYYFSNKGNFSISILKVSNQPIFWKGDEVTAEESDIKCKEEFPKFYNELKEFISFVKSILKCDVYAYSYPRKGGRDFFYYHFYMDFKGYATWDMENENETLKEIDKDILLDAFYDIKDEFSFSEHNYSFLNNGHMFVTEDMWPGNGYSISYRDPADMKSKYYDDRRGKFEMSIYLKSKSLTKENTNNINVRELTGGESKKFISDDYPGLIDMCHQYPKVVKSMLKGQETEFHYNHCVIELRNFIIYRIRLSFSIWTPLFHETPHGRILNMLKSMEWDEDTKSKLKDLGYNI